MNLLMGVYLDWDITALELFEEILLSGRILQPMHKSDKTSIAHSNRFLSCENDMAHAASIHRAVQPMRLNPMRFTMTAVMTASLIAARASPKRL